MSLAAATVNFAAEGPVLTAGRSLPVETLVLGRPIAEAAELLPRIFNLCRAAQGTAACLALGLMPVADPVAEIIRDHTVKLCVVLPRCLGWPAIAIPQDPSDLLGPKGLPRSIAALAAWESPLASCARAIAGDFAPGVATCSALPAPSDPLATGAFENSAAGRQSRHPLLQEIESAYGRGPLWRYCGLVADLEAALSGQMPAPDLRDGTATVAAARGTYALRLQHAGGIVTGMTRRTPTDHLLSPGGALLQSLKTLPLALRHFADRIVALHDPCIPVSIGEAFHA